MKRIVITGALGHIGSKLIRDLPSSFQGCEIVMIDNLLTQRYASLFDLPPNGKYSFHEKDVLKDDLTDIIYGSDAVIHLAAITNAAGSFENQTYVEQVNYEGTKRVAETCIRAGSKLIFISTTSVYGTQEEKVDENCSEKDLKPQSPYAKSKLDSEHYLKSIKNDLPFVTFRFGTIFGYSVGMRFHTAVNKFCWQAVMKHPITVWKTAYRQKRPYLDLEDGCRALIFALKNDLFDGETYNILTLNATVKDITDTIEKKVGNMKIEFVESAIMNQLSYEVSNEKFQKFGFNFKGNLECSISEAIDRLKQSNSATWKQSGSS